MLFEAEDIQYQDDVLSSPLRNNFNSLEVLLNGGLGDENIDEISESKIAFNITTGHKHDGAGSRKLDWDEVWSDAVHTHASNAEGGQLDWDSCWLDAVHSHATDAEGGSLDSRYLRSDTSDTMSGTLTVNTINLAAATLLQYSAATFLTAVSTNLYRFFDRAGNQALELDSGGAIRTGNHWSVVRREDDGALPAAENGMIVPWKNSGSTSFRFYFCMNGAWRNAGPD